jgi:hypothetical protein
MHKEGMRNRAKSLMEKEKIQSTSPSAVVAEHTPMMQHYLRMTFKGA